MPNVRAYVTSVQRGPLPACAACLARCWEFQTGTCSIYLMPSWAFSKQLIISNVWDIPSTLSACHIWCFYSGYQLSNLATQEGPAIAVVSLPFGLPVLNIATPQLLGRKLWGFPWARQWANVQSLLTLLPQRTMFIAVPVVQPSLFLPLLILKIIRTFTFPREMRPLVVHSEYCSPSFPRRALKHIGLQQIDLRGC